MNRKASLFLAYFLPAILIAWRMPHALFRAEFWAEDGTEFFQTAFLGVQSLWTPVWGYHFFWCRLIAFAATAFPVVWIPYLYAAACLVTTSFCLGYFHRDGFSWLIEGRWRRVAVCAFFALIPGSGEVSLNLCNLHSVLTLFAILLLLEKPWTLSWKRFGVFFFLSFCAGQMILLVPLIFAIGYLTRNRRYYGLGASFLPIFILNAIGNHGRAAASGNLNYQNALKIPRLLIENFFDRFLYGPLLGNYIAQALMRNSNFVYWPVSIFVAWILWRLIRRFRVSRQNLLLFGSAILSTLGTYAMIAIARAPGAWLVSHSSGDLTWDGRYSYLPGFLSTLLWSALFFSLTRVPKTAPKWGGYLLLAYLIYTNFNHWRHTCPRPDLHWPEQAPRFQEAVDLRAKGKLQHPVTVPLRLHPQSPGWEVQNITIHA